MINRKNILLIDPTEKFASQLQILLFTNSSTGTVMTARSLTEASELLCSDHYDIIISCVGFDERLQQLIDEMKKEISSMQVISLTEETMVHYDGVVDHYVLREDAFRMVPKILAL